MKVDYEKRRQQKRKWIRREKEVVTRHRELCILEARFKEEPWSDPDLYAQAQSCLDVMIDDYAQIAGLYQWMLDHLTGG